MKISTIVIGLLLFALAAMILYGWGMVKQKNQSKDLMRLLFSKGESRIKKYMKENDSITRAQAQKLCNGLEAKMPFSANKAVVKNQQDFADQLLSYMVKTGQLKKEGTKYVKIKKEGK